jgi:hypothetical protein
MASAATMTALRYIAPGREEHIGLVLYKAGGNLKPAFVRNRKHLGDLVAVYKKQIQPRRREIKIGIECLEDLIAKKSLHIAGDDVRLGTLRLGPVAQLYPLQELENKLLSLQCEIDDVVAGAGFPDGAGLLADPQLVPVAPGGEPREAGPFVDTDASK